MPIGQAMKMNHETEPFFWGLGFFRLATGRRCKPEIGFVGLSKSFKPDLFFVQQAWSTTFHSQLAHLPE